MTNLKSYFDLIMNERQWSWTVIGAAYLLLALTIRLILFQGILKESKQIDRSLHSETLRLYLKHSLAGWVLFAFSLILVVALWIGWKTVPANKTEFFLALWLLSVLFLLSLISHSQALTKALLTILRQRTGVEKEF